MGIARWLAATVLILALFFLLGCGYPPAQPSAGTGTGTGTGQGTGLAEVKVLVKDQYGSPMRDATISAIKGPYAIEAKGIYGKFNPEWGSLNMTGGELKATERTDSGGKATMRLAQGQYAFYATKGDGMETVGTLLGWRGLAEKAIAPGANEVVVNTEYFKPKEGKIKVTIEDEGGAIIDLNKNEVRVLAEYCYYTGYCGSNKSPDQTKISKNPLEGFFVEGDVNYTFFAAGYVPAKVRLKVKENLESKAVATLKREISANGLSARQKANSVTAPNTVEITVDVGYNDDLLSLLVRPELPKGWKLTYARGNGEPEIRGEEIILTKYLLPYKRLSITYGVSVPSGESLKSGVRTAVEYTLKGMANPERVYATPNPIAVQ